DGTGRKDVEPAGQAWQGAGPAGREGGAGGVGAGAGRGTMRGTGGEADGNRWKRVETTIRMGTVKVGKSCSRTPRKPESGGESAGNRRKGVETAIRMGTGKGGKSCSRTPRKTTTTLSDSPENPRKR